MTNDERTELAEKIAAMCDDEQLDGMVIISSTKDGDVMFYAVGNDNRVLAESAAHAAKLLFEESKKDVIYSVSPSSSLH